MPIRFIFTPNEKAPGVESADKSLDREELMKHIVAEFIGGNICISHADSDRANFGYALSATELPERIWIAGPRARGCNLSVNVNTKVTGQPNAQLNQLFSDGIEVVKKQKFGTPFEIRNSFVLPMNYSALVQFSLGSVEIMHY